MQPKKPPQPSARNAPVKAPRQTCPNCHALIQDGDIICVACGTNLLTGQKIAGEEKIASRITMRIVWLSLAALAAVILLAVLAVVVVKVLSRDPVQQAVDLALANKDLEATNILTSHLDRHPKDAAAYMVLGKIQWRLSQFANAAGSFENAAAAEPTNMDAAMLAVLSLSSMQGETTRDRQVAILNRLVQAYPDDSRAWYLLALERGAANNLPGEVEALKKVINLSPGDAGAQQQLGIALALQGDYAGAERQLAAMASDVGKKDAAAAVRGFVANLDKKQDVAEQHLRDAVAGKTSVRDQALTRLGLLLVSQGKFDDADTYLAEAASNKDNGAAQFFHGVCLQAKGLLPEATQVFQTVAQKTGPLGVESLVRIANLQVAQGNLQQAREALDKVEAAGGGGAALCTARGRFHAASNEDDRAREWFQKAIQADPNCAAAHLENGLLYVKRQAIDEGVKELDRYISLVGSSEAGSPASEVEALLSHLRQATEKEDRGRGPAEKVVPRRRK